MTSFLLGANLCLSKGFGTQFQKLKGNSYRNNYQTTSSSVLMSPPQCAEVFFQYGRTAMTVPKTTALATEIIISSTVETCFVGAWRTGGPRRIRRIEEKLVYPTSHNHGSEKWVPPVILVTFQLQPFSTEP